MKKLIFIVLSVGLFLSLMSCRDTKKNTEAEEIPTEKAADSIDSISG